MRRCSERSRLRVGSACSGIAVAVLVLGSCASADDATAPEDASAPTAVAPTTPASSDVAQPTTTSLPTASPLATPEPTATVVAVDAPTPPPNPTSPPPTPTPTPEPECTLVVDGPGPPGEVEIDVQAIVERLEVPWGLAFLPSGDMLVTERPGRLRLVRDGQLVGEPVLELAVSRPEHFSGIDRLGSEGGLLGVLLHPDFETTRFFYLFFNSRDEQGHEVSRIVRYTLSVDATAAEPDRVIIDGLPAGVHHQGGRMRIGPDGMLYVGVGAHDPELSQDPTSLAGKLLRMDLDGNIPPDNPDPASLVFLSGVRNSQGFDWFDDEHLVVVDHGPSGLELGMPELRGLDEVNVVRAGENLGWAQIWGCDEGPGLVSPLLSWLNSVPPTGGLFYRDGLIPEWTDSFLFTAVGSAAGDGHHLHRVVFAADNPYEVLHHELYLRREFGRLRTVTAAPDGSIYVMTSNCDNRGACPPNGDLILRITPR